MEKQFHAKFRFAEFTLALFAYAVAAVFFPPRVFSLYTVHKPSIIVICSLAFIAGCYMLYISLPGILIINTQGVSVKNLFFHRKEVLLWEELHCIKEQYASSRSFTPDAHTKIADTRIDPGVERYKKLTLYYGKKKIFNILSKRHTDYPELREFLKERAGEKSSAEMELIQS